MFLDTLSFGLSRCFSSLICLPRSTNQSDYSLSPANQTAVVAENSTKEDLSSNEKSKSSSEKRTLLNLEGYTDAQKRHVLRHHDLKMDKDGKVYLSKQGASKSRNKYVTVNEMTSKHFGIF